MDRIKLSKILAIVASILSITGVVLCYGMGIDMAIGLVAVGIVLSLVSYVACGFFKAIGSVFNIAKWGLVACPFPYNCVAFPVIAILAVFAFLLCPVLITRKA